MNLEVEVGTGGEAHGTHASDLLACVHVFAHGNVEGLHVAVYGHGAVIVEDADPLAVAGGWAGIDNGAVHDGKDGGSDGVGDVNAGVERTPARAEARGEGAFSGAGNGRGASCKVLGGAVSGSLDGLAQLVNQVGDRLCLSHVEDLRRSIGGTGWGVINLGSISGKLVVDRLRRGGGRCSVVGLNVCGSCAAYAGGGHGTGCNGHDSDTTLCGLRGDNLAMAAGATLNFASH